MNDGLAFAVAFNYLCLVVIAALWAVESHRADRIAAETAGITRELTDLWTLMGQVLDYCQYLAGTDEPATAPIAVTPDTQPSDAIVIGGARVTGEAAEPARRSHDWIEERLANYAKTGSWT